MIWDNSQTEADVKTDRFFIFIAVLDLADFFITGNNLWWSYQLTYSKDGFYFIVPFSMNVLSVVCFIIYSHRQWKMNSVQ